MRPHHLSSRLLFALLASADLSAGLLVALAGATGCGSSHPSGTLVRGGAAGESGATDGGTRIPDGAGADLLAATRACTSDDACAGTTPHCDLASGRCGACLPDVDCAGGSACDPVSGACVECVTDGDCAAPTATCDLIRHQCVASCRTAATGACTRGLVCDAAAGACVACVRNADCARGTVCDRAGGACVGCLVDSDCPIDSPVCTPGHSCSDACASDVDCQDGSGPGPPGDRSVCDPRSHLCVDCVGNVDCGADSFCRADGTCG
jgi:hypothetical protein